MATVQINTARVSKLVGENGAFQIVETYNGDWTRYWTVWNKDQTVTPTVDSFVTVAGEMNAKVRTYETKNGDIKNAVDLSINDPIINTIATAGMTDTEIAAAGLIPVEEIDDETPF